MKNRTLLEKIIVGLWDSIVVLAMLCLAVELPLLLSDIFGYDLNGHGGQTALICLALVFLYAKRTDIKDKERYEEIWKKANEINNSLKGNKTPTPKR